MRRWLAPGSVVACAVVTVCLAGLVACGSDDPTAAGSATPTPTGGGAPAATDGGSGSGSGPGASGTPSPDRALQAVTTSYQQFVLGETASLRADARRFTDAIRAGNLAGAKELYAPSRQSWERIAPIAGLVPELDRRLDGRVDEFAGPADPRFTGWHRLEYLLWVTGSTAGAKPFANQLDADLAALQARLRAVQLTPKAVAVGAGELVREVAKVKITDVEDRYSHTDLWDIGANIAGAESAMRVFVPALNAKDRTLLAGIQRDFATVDRALVSYRTPSGAYKPLTALPAADRARLRAQLGALSTELAKLPAALGMG